MIDGTELKEEILAYLKKQGFKYNPHIRLSGTSKRTFRRVQQASRTEQIEIHRNLLKRASSKVEPFIRNGSEINPKNISLGLREVETGSLDAHLFNWWNLVWWRSGNPAALKQYQNFRDPHSSLSVSDRKYSFMTIGPVSLLSFSGTPLFLTAFNDIELYKSVNGLS